MPITSPKCMCSHFSPYYHGVQEYQVFVSHASAASLNRTLFRQNDFLHHFLVICGPRCEVFHLQVLPAL